MSNFQLLEIVGRGSETQLQVGENLYQITYREKDQFTYYCWHILVE